MRYQEESHKYKFNLANRKVWVPGANGMVSSAILRRLSQEKATVYATNRDEVNLLEKAQVEDFYKEISPDVVILAAAKVGGIYANSHYPADFISQNLSIAQNVIDLAYKYAVKKLLFLGSSCIYPRQCPQPIKEEYLLTGCLESTNQWYAIAKIAGIKLCQAYRAQYACDFISAMPTNLYGPKDNFHPQDSHVPAALLRRFHEAKINNKNNVIVWGTGKPCREFLHVDDLADASIFILKNYSALEPINIGTGSDICIKDFANLIKATVGYSGDIIFDPSFPDGTPKKLLDISKIKSLGWESKISLDDGLKEYYSWYLENIND